LASLADTPANVGQRSGEGGAAAAFARGRDLVLLPFGQILLSRSRVAGGIVLLAAACTPAALACALLALLGAGLTIRLLSIDGSALDEGPHGGNAVFAGMGVGWAFGLTPTTGALALGLGVLTVAVASFAVVVATRTLSLPVLSLPFVVVYDLALAAAPALGVAARYQPPPPAARSVVEALVSGIGALVFAPRFEVGLLLLAALVVHSRIAFSLAAVGALVVAPFLSGAPPDGLAPALVLNAVLTAMALGGVLFIPSGSSFALAALGALVSAFLTIALRRPLATLGMPLLVLPFNLAVLLVLCATAQRRWRARPARVDFIPGSPEQNLTYDRVRAARAVGDRPLSLRLPFRGVWCCTQGVDGVYTHRGPWRYAVDFEVRGLDGAFHAGDGRRVEDYHCFRLPVLAAADGTVARIENDVPDNAVGAVDLQRNWGNVVVIQHGPAIYSLVAHLAQGSVAVRKGQFVRRGDVIGFCGSSGRSPRPHLHFQLQSTEIPGAPTIPFKFDEACLHPGLASPESARLVTLAEPAVGESWSHLEPSAALTELFALAMPTSGHATFTVNGRCEVLSFEIDLLGRHVIRGARGGALFLARGEGRFTVLDVLARPDSVLHALRAALSHVPLLADESIRWRDVLPSSQGRASVLGFLRDFVSPFLAGRTLEMEYHFERRRDRLAIVGQSLALGRLLVPIIRTRVELTTAGLAELAVIAGRRHWHAVRAVERALAPPTVLVPDSRSKPRPPLARAAAGGGG
jgi:murein DD-endopeptidase MepM/ murein hydrolase activator NlpD